MKFKRYIRNTLMAIGRNTKEMVELASSSLVIFRQMEPAYHLSIQRSLRVSSLKQLH
jgi:hypothetical protein